ncbi:hypothetical protein WR25_15416 [Diploscapter pachys]|uniref:ETFB lysine methyltransferase n=1 Tax=Diploscapter pachys TaxID=2018661 RepID=A0A2A2LN28_9BILA|nr:hypothetical protein WR25_15416 [Diploscapter pachys]
MHSLKMGARRIARWIMKNTVVSRESLTPEIALRLITETCPLWMATPDKCPFPNPYWAFYWPGGQAATRYILDNKKEFSGKTVFDFGAGCGSASIASAMVGTRSIANDIDSVITVALVSIALNYRLNKLSDANVQYTNKNFLSPMEIDNFPKDSIIVLGDMFYDTDFTELTLKWLARLQKERGTRALVGDPDRHPMADRNYAKSYSVKFSRIPLVDYPLPDYIIREHYGFNTAKVYELVFN